MLFATRSRRSVRSAPAFTAVPFDAPAGGIGAIPPQIAIETPDSETLLVLCAETERADERAERQVQTALGAFLDGFASPDARGLTAALLAGVREANAALYDPRALRRGVHPAGVGLTALAVRGDDAYVLQVGPGQALVLHAGETVALPPLESRYASGYHARAHGATAPLGVLPDLDPDLFHIDARAGMRAVVAVSALGRVLAHEDDRSLHLPDPAAVAETLIAVARHYRLPEAYGVVVATGDDGAGMGMDDESGFAPPPRWRTDSGDLALRPPPSDRPRKAWSYRLPVVEPEREDAANPWDAAATDVDAAWDRFAPEQRRTGAHIDDYALRPPPSRRRPRPQAGFDPRAFRPPALPALPPRLWMLIGAVALTLVLAALIAIVQTVGARRVDGAARKELDAIATARAQAVALRDPQAAYTALVALVGQLDAITATSREPERVAAERQQLVQAIDTVGNVTRVTPRVIGTLARYEGAPGARRLLMRGEDGKLYLYERDARGDWGVFLFDPNAARLDRLFSTGSVAYKVPASDIRGLVWVTGPATTDRTRLFVRAGSGAWQEATLMGIGEKRPTALVAFGDAIYALDSDVGRIIRVPFRDGGAATPWTGEAVASDLRSAVDMTADTQTIWVLLADGRVRGFVGGTPAQSFTLTAAPALKGVGAMVTTARSPYLYIAESGPGSLGRILRVRKVDGRVVQIIRAAEGAPPLAAIQSMAVDEATGTLWAVTADGIITTAIPPIAGG